MATLTDEERAAQVLGDVEGTEVLDETAEHLDTQDEEAEQPGSETEADAEEDEEKPTDSEEETEVELDGTFTKQFPNLKGETLKDYNENLETAYDNSFKESLRLVEENKQLRTEVQRLNTVQPVQQPQPGAPVPQPGNQPQPPVPAPGTAEQPDWAIRAQQRDRDDMLSSFDPFKKEYPQVLEQDNFKLFTDASDGVKLTMTKTLGRVPTWNELYKGIAGVLGWQPETPRNKKNAAIKDAATSGGSPSRQSAAPAKPAKVSEAQVDAYLKMFTSKTREDAIKELSEVV